MFSNIVSVSMICSYWLLTGMWSHRKNSDISMTFSVERGKKKKIFLSFFLIQCWVRDGTKKGRGSFLPTDSILLVATMDDMLWCSFLCHCFLKLLCSPDTLSWGYIIETLMPSCCWNLRLFRYNMLYIQEFYLPWDSISGLVFIIDR